MKYGYNDNNFKETIYEMTNTPFTTAVATFWKNGFLTMMKRKTVLADEVEMLNALKEMTTMLENHINTINEK